MFADWPLLSILIWTQILGGAVILATSNPNNPTRSRVIALFASLACLALCVPLAINFNANTYEMQFVENIPWITDYGINYHLGVDGISLPLVILSCFTTLIVVLAAWRSVTTKVSQYLAAFLTMQGMMVGVFSAVDSIVFYIFWEAILIPMYLGIGIWGSANRTYASIKFFLYTFLGSALMLIALLYLSLKANSFDILSFYPLRLNQTEQNLIFIAFFMAFAIKVPMWPVHTWLPDAHTEAPAGGSVVLAALMLKMGIYGFLRFSLPIVPDVSQSIHWLMIALSLIAIIYIAFIAIAQRDMKRLIAYSSIAHMGFATLGCFIIYEIIAVSNDYKDAYMALEGGMVIMISHAFSSGALFACVGVLYDRMHSRMIGDFGGVATKMPVFAAFFMIFAMANVGLPGTSGFVGEFMVIVSSLKAGFWVSFLAATTLILGAGYTLWMVKRVFFGEIKNEQVAKLEDLYSTEILVFALCAGLILFLGIYPKPLLDFYHSSVDHLLKLALASKLS